MEWRKPELICINVEELVCKVRAKANSLPSCVSTYAEDHACPELDVGDTWGDGGEGTGIGCGILSQCVEIGPLFGCDDSLACSSLATVFR